MPPLTEQNIDSLGSKTNDNISLCTRMFFSISTSGVFRVGVMEIVRIVLLHTGLTILSSDFFGEVQFDPSEILVRHRTIVRRRSIVQRRLTGRMKR